MGSSLQTPVVFLIFNRPAETQRALQEIAKARPTKLFVVADGPRPERPEEARLCAEARAVIERVDWDCKVFKNYSDTNLGCADRVSSGISWVFEQVETAIILEDDCLPLPDFFSFCDDLLIRYKDDNRIMTIAGNNFQFGHKRTDDSYYFSYYAHCWGWATWRRAWQLYDHEMKLWPQIQNSRWLEDILCNPAAVDYWEKTLQDVFEKKISSWNIRWLFSSWVQNGLTILPNENLVTNVGFGSVATNTKVSSPLANMAVHPLSRPFKHPAFVVRDTDLDRRTQTLYSRGRLEKVRKTLSRMFSSNRNLSGTSSQGIHSAPKL